MYSWAIFRVVGANPKLKSMSIAFFTNEWCSSSGCLSAMYQFYQVMICLLKFDFFAFTGVTMQACLFLCSSTILLTLVTLSAAHRCTKPQLRRVRGDDCCYPCRFSAPGCLRYRFTARNQMVCYFHHLNHVVRMIISMAGS
jgi:hypothetical protein